MLLYHYLYFARIEMFNFDSKKRHFRELLIYVFYLMKYKAEVHHMLKDAYNKSEFEIEDKESSGRIKLFTDTKFEAVLD